MARTKTINYRRVTFSFPAKLLRDLRKNVGKNGMSSYVAELVKEDLERREAADEEVLEFIQSLKDFRESAPSSGEGKSSVELIRELRYGDEK